MREVRRLRQQGYTWIMMSARFDGASPKTMRRGAAVTGGYARRGLGIFDTPLTNRVMPGDHPPLIGQSVGCSRLCSTPPLQRLAAGLITLEHCSHATLQSRLARPGDGGTRAWRA